MLLCGGTIFFFFYHTSLYKIGPRPINFKGKDKYNYEFLDLKNGSTQTQLVEWWVSQVDLWVKQVTFFVQKKNLISGTSFVHISQF